VTLLGLIDTLTAVVAYSWYIRRQVAVAEGERGLMSDPQNGIDLAAPRSSHVLHSIGNIAEVARSAPRSHPRAPLQPERSRNCSDTVMWRPR
jgi:hypothetical protein